MVRLIPTPQEYERAVRQLRQQLERAERERDELRAENERLQRENGSLARTYAACEHMLRERTEQLNQADAENERRSTKRPSELDVQDRVADAIWFVPQSEEASAHYVLEYSGRGPKAYLNLWLGAEYGQELTEWNWVLYESAVELWRRDATDQEVIDVLLPVNDLTRERDELRAALANSEAATLIQLKLLRAENERLRAALEGVIAEADRKTAAFDRARAALGHPKCR